MMSRLSSFLAVLCVVAWPGASEFVWEPVPIRSIAEKELGLPGGEGHQHMRGMDRPAADPDRVYVAIDTAGTWRSDDGGRSWHKNTDEGLYSGQLEALAADPDRPDRLLVIAASPSGWQGFMSQHDGVYLSEDAGRSWRRVLQTPVHREHLPYQRIYRRSIVFGPADESGERAVFAGIDGGTIFRSIDGGLAWRPWADAESVGVRRTWYQLVAVHDDKGRVVVLTGSNDGLHRYHDANGDGKITPDEVDELPVPDPYPAAIDKWGKDYGTGVSSVLVHPDRPQDIVAVRRNGLTYRTTTGGRTPDAWQRIVAVKENDRPDSLEGSFRGNPAGTAMLGFQDPYRPDHRWLMTVSTVYRAEWEGDRMRWKGDPRGDVETEPYLLEPITRHFRNNHSAILFSPNERDDLVAYKYIPWRHDPATDRWVYGNDGFTGFAWTQQPTGARWIPPDFYDAWGGRPGVVFFCNDIGPVVSRDGLASFTMTGGDVFDASGKGYPGTAWSTSTAGDIDPADPDHLIAFFGRVGGGSFSLTRSLDGGRSWSIHPEPDRKTRFNAVNFRHVKFAHFLGDHPATDGLVAGAASIMTTDARAETPIWERVRFEQTLPGGASLSKIPSPDTLGTQGDPGYVIGTGHVSFDGQTTLPTLWAYNTTGGQHVAIGLPNTDASADEQPYRWSLVYDDWRHALKGAADGVVVLAADPHEPNAVYFALFRDVDRDDHQKESAPSDKFDDNEVWIARLHAEDPTVTHNFASPAVTKRRLAGGGGEDVIDVPPGRFQSIRAIAADPDRAGVVYFSTIADGVSNVYQAVFPVDRSDNQVEVNDVSGDLGREGIGALSIRPDTGDLYIGSHFGTWRLSADQLP